MGVERSARSRHKFYEPKGEVQSSMVRDAKHAHHRKVGVGIGQTA